MNVSRICKACLKHLFTILFLSIFTISCGKDTNQKKKILRVHAFEDPYHLDPRMAGDTNSQISLRMLFEGLMRFNKDEKPDYAAADRVIISSDKKTYTFHLRESYWSNGEKVTAYDFEYAWKRILSPDFPSVFGYAFYIIKNAKLAKENNLPIDQVGIKAINDQTLIVELEHPAPYFLDLICNPIYSPAWRKLDEIEPDLKRGMENFVSNGPFHLKSWELRNQLIFEKSETYWDHKSVKLYEVHIYLIPDENTALKMYELDEIDWIGPPNNIPLDSTPYLQKHHKLLYPNSTKIKWFMVNVNQFPYNNNKMRKALAFALNRKAIAEHILQSGDTPLMSILPSNQSLRKEPYFQDHDIAKAKQLFNEALEEMNLSLDQFPPIRIQSIKQNYVLLQAIQEQWRKTFNIEVQLDLQEWNLCMVKLCHHEYDITLMSWESWFNDPIYNMEILRDTSTDKNYPGWENPRYTALLKAADEEIDGKKKKRIPKNGRGHRS